jgi:Flp pilus assembly protein TadG
MKLLKDEGGQVLVLTLISATLLMAFMALAVDVGILFRARRNMQIAADAAAMAGAMQLYYGPASSVTSAAQAAAKLNGVDGAVSGNTVQIYSPPNDGPNKGCMSCVEAVVATPNRTFFMGLFTPGDQTVAARAVAGAPGASDACVWLVDPSLDDELDMQGAGAVNAANCGIYVNSNQADAVTYNNGHKGNINAASLSIVGNDTDAKSNLTGVKVQINVTPESPDIPLNLGGTPSGGCTSTVTSTEVYASSNPPKKPGSAVSDSSISGSSGNRVVCFTSSNVQIDSGVVLGGAVGNGVIYVFEHGVNLSGAVQFGSYSGTIPPNGGTFDPTQTNGAVLDIAGGGFGQGNAQLSIFAPTSGTYNGIALMQPITNTTDNKCPANKSADPCLLVQRGSSNSTFDGIIYAPGEDLEIQDGGGGVSATGVIAAGLYAKGSGTLNINGYSKANPTTTPFRTVTMME